MPKISVIIPVYKVEKYLAYCLNSILSQSFQDYEVICVNDGSPDNCGKILADYAQKSDKLKVITQANQGLSMARNNGLKEASGQYIYFLDSDDTVHPQLLEILYTYAERYQAELVSFDFDKTNSPVLAGERLNIRTLAHHVTNTPIFYASPQKKYRINFNACTKFYQRQLLNDIEFIPHIQFEDFPHTFTILAKHPKTVILPQKLYFYTANLSSISKQRGTPQQIRDYHTGINAIYNIYNKPEYRKEFAFLLKNFIPNILKQQLKRCELAQKNCEEEMYQTFAEELKDLNNKGLINWHGHRLTRYLTYKKLIKGTFHL